MLSNKDTTQNTKWTEDHILDLVPSFKNVKPNQHLANKLKEGLESGKVKLTKKSADLLYQLNTNPKLEVNIDPSNIPVVKTGKSSARIAYTDIGKWGVFGSVSIRKRIDGSYHIYDDTYKFDIKSAKQAEKILGRKEKNTEMFIRWIRNAETYLGEPNNGFTPESGGTRFMFRFDRDKPVNLLIDKKVDNMNKAK